ncbi:MAG: phosphoribosylglycinamide formyltransferase [Ghiorsea sp.]
MNKETNTQKLAVLASGKGSNLKVILDAMQRGDCPGKVQLVICNKEDAGALDIARQAGVEQVVFINPKDYTCREDYDAACVQTIQGAACHWIILAGYMRILSPAFIEAFPNQIINIHPSLLPSFVGGDAVGDALKHGVKITGCTVHLVTEKLDDGAILAQASVPVLEDDDHASLHQRIQAEEHRIYPQTIAHLLQTPFHIDGRRVVWQKST